MLQLSFADLTWSELQVISALLDSEKLVQLLYSGDEQREQKKMSVLKVVMHEC